jgi:hypothetical protein
VVSTKQLAVIGVALIAAACATGRENVGPATVVDVMEAAVAHMRVANPVQASTVLDEQGFRARRDSLEAFVTVPAADVARIGSALGIPVSGSRQPCDIPAHIRTYSADVIEWTPLRASVWVTGTESSPSTWMTISSLVRLELSGGAWKAESSTPLRIHGECPAAHLASTE